MDKTFREDLIINKIREAETKQILNINEDSKDVYVLGQLDSYTPSQNFKNYNYTQWRSMGFGHKKARLLSKLNFHTYITNITLIRFVGINEKNLNSLAFQTNKQLTKAKINFRIVSKFDTGKKLKHLASTL